MTKPEYKYLHIILFSAILLMAQVSSFIHNAEHPNHIADSTCQAFHLFDKSSHSPLPASLNLTLVNAEFSLNPAPVVVTLSSFTLRTYLARAPPFIS